MFQERYLVTGGSGFIGSHLVRQLAQEGKDVTVLTRNRKATAAKFDRLLNHKPDPKLANPPHYQINTTDSLESLPDDATFDVIINLAGQGIADKRWSDSVKQQILDSRIGITQALFEFVKQADVKPDVLISGSAIGYYGINTQDAIGREAVSENSLPDNSFSSQVCQKWEAAAGQIEQLGVRTCYLRTGIVLGKTVEGRAGGALTRMLPPFRFGLGGPIGNGQQWMPWIHLDDLLGIIRFAIETTHIAGPINGTAPNPVTNREFSRSLGKLLHRPAVLPMPAIAVKLLFGQMGEELLLSGKKVLPEYLLEQGYRFQSARIDDALSQIVNPV